MNRLKKLLAAATLLVLPVIAACGEDVIPPPATGSIAGQVSIEGMGIDGVSVNLSNGASTTTAGGGTYRFDGVEAGAYTVTISGFPADASFDATSAAATIPETGGSVTLDFRGSYIRTASIMGTVTVENTGLGGVTVVLSGMSDATTATDMNGQYAFTGLRSGTYSVEISGFDSDEVGFGSISSAATVGVGESKIISFDGTYLRTAGIMGQVSVEGVGLPNVTVTMTGEGEDKTDVTDAGGLYAFSKLKAGAYSVAISGYDPDEVEFTSTSMNVTVALGETANIPFNGTLLRTSGISGRVSVEGMGLDGVAVVLAGAAEATKMTANGGQYAFAGLAEGTYVLTMANPDADAYTFETTSANVVLGDSESNITNFEGTHTRTASVSGVLFIDEVMQDKMLTTGEPSLTAAIAPLVVHELLDQEMLDGLLANAKVLLRGPDLNTMTEVDINVDGTYTTGESLRAGSYQVELPANNEMVAAALAAAGVAFVGESAVVTVEAAGMATVNFPFRITMQTIGVEAVMGNDEETGDPVPGVELALYPTAQDAEAGTNMLGMGGETNEMGMAAFQFARADDSSPAGDDSDNLVFVKVTDAGHADLEVSDNDVIEIEYPGIARVHSAPASVRLLNTAVSFVFWVKSNETARDGNEFLASWNTMVTMGDSEDALMMVDEDGDTINATMPTDTAMATKGKSTFSYKVTAADMPAMFTVSAIPVDEDGKSVQPDMGEVWEQGDGLMHTHTGLELPLGEDDDMTDLGPIRISYTTQAVYVGTHRELDDRTGFTDYLGLDGGGDDRPTKDGNALGEIEVSVMVADSRGRLNVLEYDDDMDAKTDDVEATKTFDDDTGIVSFAHIPADMEITIVADVGSDIVILPDTRSSLEIDAYGDQLDDFPDGVMKGAFGEGASGARPDVWICPLWRLDNEDPKENCSTFAYKWADGTISGSISDLRKGDKATVTLTPVNSNDEYSDDLEEHVDFTAGTGGTKSFSFDGVADGRYMLTLEANPGSWGEKKSDPFSVIHNEDSDDDEYSGATVPVPNLSATDLRGTITGRIANDSGGRRGSLNGDESRSGVVVALHQASAKIASGLNKGRRSAGKAVTDADGDPVTAETDGEGVFVFENLVVKRLYFLMPESTGLYTAVRNGNTDIASQKSTDVVTQALTSAVVPSADPDFEPPIPRWNYHTSMALDEGRNDFVLLYTNAEVQGEVSDPSVRAAHQYSTVELYRCKTTDYRPAGTDIPEVLLTGCDSYVDRNNAVTANVGDDGEWIADDLMEGIYEVVVDLPAGYVNVDAAGVAAGETNYSDGNVVEDGTGFSQQVAELTGGRADDGTATFHIKDRNAGGLAEIPESGVTVDGDACDLTGTGDNAICVHNKQDDTSIVVKATASRGATITLSTSATDPEPRGDSRWVPVSNGRNTTVTLPKAGSTRFYVHVAAEDGYSTNATAGTGNNEVASILSVRRDADVRVNTVRLSWGGDKIELDRDGLDLDDDGETGVVTGTTVLSVTVDKGDGGDAIPITDLVVSVTSMTPATRTTPEFGVATWAAYNLMVDSPVCGNFPETGNGTITLPLKNQDESKGSDGVCIRITDSDGGTGDEADTNPDNVRNYILIVTRK